MDTNSKDKNYKTQDTSTTKKGKNAIDDTWTLEKANALVDELLKDIPVIPAKGSVIWPVRKPYLSAKPQQNTQTTQNNQTNGAQNRTENE